MNGHPSPKRSSSWKITCRRAGCALLLIPCSVIGTFLLFISLFSPPGQPASSLAQLPPDFMRGIAYESWQRGQFQSANSDTTLETIVRPSEATWLQIIVKCYQDTLTSTEIDCNTDPRTSSDDEIRYVVERAHGMGLKVMLKPHVDPLHLANSSSGRFQITFGSDEAAWTAWFASYTRFITHYARLAQALEVEYFTVGTELYGTVHREREWREVIAQVRAVYDGPLTYAALTYFEPLAIRWWDAVDAIGIDAYFGLTLTNRPTIAQMRLGWMPNIAFIGWLANHWRKPVILTEIGYMSVDGTNILPGDWSLQGSLDPQEQADAYQALMESFAGHDWWQGIFWYSLTTDPLQGGANDRGYTFHDKPAEQVVRRFFRRATAQS